MRPLLRGRRRPRDGRAVPVRPSAKRLALTDYIVERIRTECTKRGAQGDLARALGFSSAHVANVATKRCGVGDEFLEAIAKYWKLSRDDLDRIAAERMGMQVSYPCRTTAVALARTAARSNPSEWREDAIALIEKEQLPVDLPVADYLLRIWWKGRDLAQVERIEKTSGAA